MKTSVRRLRIWVFKVWFVTLFVILATYVVRMVTLRQTPLEFSAVFQSLQMMVGLVLPQLAVMVAFYLNLDRQQQKIESLSDEQITIIVWLSIAYHVIFLSSVIAGIGFNAFASKPDDPDFLQQNTAAVLAIVGLFSLFLAPIAFLFAAPKKDDVPPSVEGTSN